MVMPGKSGSSTPKRISMLRRLCCASNGIKEILYIMSCWNHPKVSLVIVIDYNWYETSFERKTTEMGHDKLILLHDNARSHVAKQTKQYLEEMKWEILSHPPYSPDIAPFICSSPCSRPFLESDTIIIKVSKNGWAWWMDHFKKIRFFSFEKSVLPERWEKVRWSIFWMNSFCLFR